MASLRGMALERTAYFPKWALRYRGCSDSCPQHAVPCTSVCMGTVEKSVLTGWWNASLFSKALACVPSFGTATSLLWAADACEMFPYIHFSYFIHFGPPGNIRGTCRTILKTKQPESKQMKQLLQLRKKDPFHSWVPACQMAADEGVQILCSTLARLHLHVLPPSP